MAEALESDNPNVVMGQLVQSGELTTRQRESAMAAYERYKNQYLAGDDEMPDRLRDWAAQMEALGVAR